MSFRRKSDLPLAWNRWVDLHREELIRAGLPAEIFSDEQRWYMFLQEGGLDWSTGWRVEMLSSQQAEILHRLISTEFPGADFVDCVRSLAKVSGRLPESPSK